MRSLVRRLWCFALWVTLCLFGAKSKTLWLSPWFRVPEHCRELGVGFCFLVSSSVVWNHCCFSSPLRSTGREYELQWLSYKTASSPPAWQDPRRGLQDIGLSAGLCQDSAHPLISAESKVRIRRRGFPWHFSGESLIPQFWWLLAWGFSWPWESLEVCFGRRARHPEDYFLTNPGTAWKQGPFHPTPTPHPRETGGGAQSWSWNLQGQVIVVSWWAFENAFCAESMGKTYFSTRWFYCCNEPHLCESEGHPLQQPCDWESQRRGIEGPPKVIY